MKRLLVGVVAMAVFAAGCSGSSEPEAAVATPAELDQAVEQDAQKLIVEIGTDDAAADALIIAMDRGYSGPQILDAVDANKLRSDGTIDGQTPQGEPLALVLYTLGGEGEGAYGNHRGISTGEVELASFYQVQQTPIETLRGNATLSRGVGALATELILRLLQRNFTAADIIEILILGIDEVVDEKDSSGKVVLSCLRVTDEFYCPGGERFPVKPATITNTADTDAARPSVADPLASDSTVGVDAVYTGQATASAIADATSASYEWQSVSFDARVEGDMVELTVTTSLFIWWRGGDRDGEYTGDQNCGGLIVETLTGSGPAGSPTTIEMYATSSELAEQRGALCEGDEPDRNLHSIGDRVGSFEGQVNGLGFSGELLTTPAVFVTTAIPLEAA